MSACASVQAHVFALDKTLIPMTDQPTDQPSNQPTSVKPTLMLRMKKKVLFPSEALRMKVEGAQYHRQHRVSAAKTTTTTLITTTTTTTTV